MEYPFIIHWLSGVFADNQTNNERIIKLGLSTVNSGYFATNLIFDSGPLSVCETSQEVHNSKCGLLWDEGGGFGFSQI